MKIPEHVKALVASALGDVDARAVLADWCEEVGLTWYADILRLPSSSSSLATEMVLRWLENDAELEALQGEDGSVVIRARSASSIAQEATWEQARYNMERALRYR